jgi:hypothetical protein
VFVAKDLKHMLPSTPFLKKRLNEGSTAKKGKAYGGQKRHQEMRSALRDMKRVGGAKKFNP